MAFLQCPTPHPQTGRTCFGVAQVTRSLRSATTSHSLALIAWTFTCRASRSKKIQRGAFRWLTTFHASFKQWCARIGSKTTWRTKHLRVHHQWQMPTKPCCQIISNTRCFWLAEKRAQPWEHHLQHPPDRQWHLDCLQSNMNRFCHQHHVFLMGKTHNVLTSINLELCIYPGQPYLSSRVSKSRVPKNNKKFMFEL